MKKFRQTLFWLHLIAGLAAGVPIVVMSFTGAALAFEKQLIAWAERDARQTAAPAANAPRLPLDELLQRARAARPDLSFGNVTVYRDPFAAIALGAPDNRTFCLNPYTGEVREASAPTMRAFMGAMRRWHTHLNASAGELFTSWGNVLFLVLGLTGLWLWWPSAWKWRMLRPSIWFQTSARGRARDWNWHNVVGFWSLPAVVLMTATGVVLSFRPVNELMYRLAGDPLPARNPAPAVPPSKPSAPPKPPAITAVFVAATVTPLLTAVQTELPSWQQVVLRLNPPNRASANIDYPAAWPPFSSATFTIDRTTGQIQRGDSYTAAPAGRRARMWVRLTHSGESFGWPGQLLAGLGCLGGCLLVWTGVAMSWRRFFGRPSA